MLMICLVLLCAVWALNKQNPKGPINVNRVRHGLRKNIIIIIKHFSGLSLKSAPLKIIKKKKPVKHSGRVMDVIATRPSQYIYIYFFFLPSAIFGIFISWKNKLIKIKFRPVCNSFSLHPLLSKVPLAMTQCQVVKKSLFKPKRSTFSARFSFQIA